MRSFVGWVALVLVLGVAGYLIAPFVARPLVAEAVRAASPFGAAPLSIDAQVSTPGLLRGQIDSLHVTGSDLSAGRLRIGRLDVTASDVAIGSHAFGASTGTLGSVALTRADGTMLRAQEVSLSGPSDTVDATASVDAGAALELVRTALGDAGLPADGVQLIDGGVRVSVLGQPTDLALGVVDGAVTIAGSIAGGGSIVVFGPEPGDPWQITGVSVSPAGLDVHARLDLGSVLEGG